MEITAESTGSYPRVGDTPELQKLRRSIQKHQSGKISDADLQKASGEMVRRSIEEQSEAGLDVVTDGLIAWNDPVSHCVRGLKGVEITGLVRFFDTNTYFRQPRITALPERNGGIVLDEYRLAAAKSQKPVKAVLTGPYTLTKLSVLQGVEEQAVEACLTEILAGEIAELRRAGATRIQIDEPELLRNPGDAGRVNANLEKLGPVGVHVYFGDATPVAEALLNGPAAWVGFDLSYSPDLLDALKRRSKPILLGCIDARTTRLENPETVAKAVRSVLRRDDAIGPTTGLEYLPRPRAREKLDILCKVRKLL